MEHDHDRPRSYSDELAVTRRLIDEGDRAHALHHCVCAIALEPHRREWHAMIRELLASKELIAKLEGDTFCGAAAALAMHEHERGDHARALDRISQVAAALPHLGFQSWFAQWLGEAGTKPGVTVDSMSVQRVLGLVTTFGIGRIRMLPAEQAAAEELAPIAAFAVKTLTDPTVLWLASATLRRAGRYREAVEAAELSRHGIAPNLGAIALGLALRANRDFDRAADVFTEIHAATGESDYLHEKLRVLADAGRWAEAVEIADELARTTELGEENVREYQLLRDKLAAGAPAPDVPPLDLVRRRALGHGHLFTMSDATANGLRSMARDRTAATPVELGEQVRKDSATITVSGYEGGSNRLTMALMFSGSPDPRRAGYTISGGSALRTIAEDVDQYTLWKLDGDVVVQALPAPPEPAADWVEQLALFEPDGTAPETLFEARADFLDMWQASDQRPRVEANARDWVAATIYPRMPVARVGMGPDWVYRWQVAALIGLARSERGWAGTARRDALFSLLTGSLDWPLAAAIRVVTEIALEEPTATAEIRTRLIELVEPLCHQPNPALAHTLLVSLDALPYVADEHKDTLRRALDRDDEVDDDEADDDQAETDDEPEPPTGKRPWWKFWGNR